MSATIRILHGIYKIRGVDVNLKDFEFQVVEGFRLSDSGGYVTVNGASANPKHSGIPERNIRIRCNGPHDYTVISGELKEVKLEPAGVTNFEQEDLPDYTIAHESDEQVIARLRDRFSILTDMTYAVKKGEIRAMIVSGPPGVGKTRNVEEVLGEDDLFNVLGGRKPKYEFVKGTISALGLYTKLYEYSGSGHVIVFDDIDSVFTDDVALNILKAALDTNKKRSIHWNTDSRLLNKMDIPKKFEFSGSVIFITNLRFSSIRSKKLQEHLAALESRCHFIDLTINTNREKLLRIRQIVNDGMLEHYEFEEDEVEEILEYINKNQHRLRELSLRTVLKCADLKVSFKDRWTSIADISIMKTSR